MSSLTRVESIPLALFNVMCVMPLWNMLHPVQRHFRKTRHLKSNDLIRLQSAFDFVR